MFNKIPRGRVFLFGKNIDTDQIYPGRFVELTDPADVVKHAMEGADPAFAAACAPGDIIVAESNFGCGSSREHAAIALQTAGLGAVVASSFSRIFYRNGINLGLPLLVCHDLHSKVKNGEVIAINLENGDITLDSGKLIAKAEVVTDYMMNILRNGGIKPMLRKELAEG
ncbi:MAG: 3-isopropylmalate dehydratase small subunit [Deltaproteobacteria bacterium]|jgi:3-isopropylmalate/(R)-2-methylmalate dehydratase small subunit|nr:3-isopropylmalate dehydratase small subunit [Deltaproteobacteria bacterium]